MVDGRDDLGMGAWQWAPACARLKLYLDCSILWLNSSGSGSLSRVWSIVVVGDMAGNIPPTTSGPERATKDVEDLLQRLHRRGNPAARGAHAGSADLRGGQTGRSSSSEAWARLGVPAADVERLRSCVAWGRSISRHWDAGGEGRANNPECRDSSAACSSEEPDERSHDRVRLNSRVSQMMRQWTEASEDGQRMPDEASGLSEVSVDAVRASLASGSDVPGGTAVRDACGQSPMGRARSAVPSPASTPANVCITGLGLSPEEDVGPVSLGHESEGECMLLEFDM